MASSLEDVLREPGESPSYSDLCKICLRNKSKYVCPRCNTPYCSLDCYKSELHLDCSEEFYQEWVEGELKGNKVSHDGQQRMLEILKRMNDDEEDGQDCELDSDDEDPAPDLSERLAGVDLNNADQVWENLSASEKAAFQELVSSGEAANIIQSWEPWWCKRFDEPKVKPLDSDDSIAVKLKAHLTKCPSVHTNIKSFNEITKSIPSPSVSFDLINILGGFVLVAKYYNGDYFDFQEEAGTILSDVSKSLHSPQNFSSPEMALDAVGLKALISEALDTTENDIDSMKKDVRLILSGPSTSERLYYILAALSDIRRLFVFPKTKTKEGKFNRIFKTADLNISIIDQKTCKLIIKRIDYFLSFTSSSHFSLEVG